MDTKVRVLLDDKAEPEQREAIKGYLEEAGFSVTLAREVYIRKSAADYLSWVIFLYVVFRPFLKSFLESFGGQLGKDAATGLKNLLARIAESRKSEKAPEGTIIILDEETRFQIWIENGDLSAEAARSFLQIDLNSFKKGPVVWDEQQKRWKSIIDEME